MNPETVSNKIVRVAAALCVALIFLTVTCSKDRSPDSPSRTFDAVQKEFLLLRARARTAEDRKRLAARYKERLENMLADLGSSPGDEARLTSGRILMQLRRYEEANNAFAPLLSDDSPRAREARLGSAQALLASGRIGSALAMFTTIQPAEGEDQDYFRIMYRLSTEVQDLDTRQHLGEAFLQATKKYHRLKAHFPAAIRNLADVIKERGRRDEAVLLLKRSMSQVPGKRGRDILNAYLKPLEMLGEIFPPPTAIEWLIPPPGIDGNTADGPLVLEFWVPWCHTCRQLIPALNSFHRELKKQGMDFITYTWISTRYGDDITAMGRVSKPDGIRLLREFIKRHRVEFPVALIEREQAVESGVHAYPTLYLLDREGIIRDFTVGHTHFDRFGSRIRSLNRLSQPAKRRVKPTGQ